MIWDQLPQQPKGQTSAATYATLGKMSTAKVMCSDFVTSFLAALSMFDGFGLH